MQPCLELTHYTTCVACGQTTQCCVVHQRQITLEKKKKEKNFFHASFTLAHNEEVRMSMRRARGNGCQLHFALRIPHCLTFYCSFLHFRSLRHFTQQLAPLVNILWNIFVDCGLWTVVSPTAISNLVSQSIDGNCSPASRVPRPHNQSNT